MEPRFILQSRKKVSQREWQWAIFDAQESTSLEEALKLLEYHQRKYKVDLRIVKISQEIVYTSLITEEKG